MLLRVFCTFLLVLMGQAFVLLVLGIFSNSGTGIRGLRRRLSNGRRPGDGPRCPSPGPCRAILSQPGAATGAGQWFVLQ